MPTIIIEYMTDGRYRLMVDRGQCGIYDTEAKAKASARRFLRSDQGITWEYGQDEAIAQIRPKRRRA